MIKKTLKTAPRKTPEMARQGAQYFTTPLSLMAEGLKSPLRPLFLIIANNIDLSAIPSAFKKVHTFGAKRPFKDRLKGGLKIFPKSGPSHYPHFSIFCQNRRFYHVKMV